MQLVINIDDKLYEIIKNPKKLETMYHAGRLCEAVRNGTPLPKGYGRLGDLDKIQSMARKKAEDYFPEGRYDYGYRKALFDFAKDIDDAPTIIEADKEDKAWKDTQYTTL